MSDYVPLGVFNPLNPKKPFFIKWWKRMSHEEKMNRLWFLFKWMIIFSLINSTLEMVPIFVRYGLL